MLFYCRSFFLLVFALLSACTMATLPRNAQEPYPLPSTPEVGEIVHIPTGTLVSEAQMLQIAADARIVYVGETHDNPAAHRLQLAVLKAMAARYPDKVTLGMEMFTPSQQEALDRWVAGEITEKEFLKESLWYRNWGMDFDYYKPLLEFARKEKIPVIGLNADKTPGGMTDKKDAHIIQKEQSLQKDQPDPYYRAMIEAFFKGHKSSDNGLESFVRMQTLWDETMAENIFRHLARAENKDKRMVVLAGHNHIRYGFGIPRRVFQRLPVSYILVGSVEIVYPPEKESMQMNVQLPEFPMIPYHFLLYSEYEIPEKKKVKLGIILGSNQGKVLVKDVLPGSTAEQFGIKKGDSILSFDGKAIRENFDLIYEVNQKSAGDSGILVIERNGEKTTIEVVFQDIKQHSSEQ